MNDVLPKNVCVWQFVETTIKQVFTEYGYSEIRLPIMEYTSLFKRGVGEVTDIVEKEMFTFDDRDGESISLRPEGTAGCVRAGIQSGILYNQEQRLWYFGPMFRYERPQKGRYRQFHQFGCEVFGIANPTIDIELLLLTNNLWNKLGIQNNVHLELNTIGSSDERNAFKRDLVAFLEQHLESLDEDCKKRLYTNPMRILDSKNQDIQKLLLRAPKLHDYLQLDSKNDFNYICNLLDKLQINYIINQNLVRGLDYYNKTVFEWVTNDLGSQGTICAGGRYDSLVEQLGGKSTSGIGFALGLERLILLVETVNKNIASEERIDVYVINDVQDKQEKIFQYAENLRQYIPNIRVMLHCSGGKFTKQFKKADQLGAKLAVVFGENEILNGQVIVKHLLEDGKQIAISEDGSFKYIKDNLGV